MAADERLRATHPLRAQSLAERPAREAQSQQVALAPSEPGLPVSGSLSAPGCHRHFRFPSRPSLLLYRRLDPQPLEEIIVQSS